MRRSRSKPGGRRKKGSSSDDFQASSDDDFDGSDRGEDGRKISTRHQYRSVSYNNMKDQSESDSSSEEEFGIFGNGKIDKIFLARQASGGLEYLVTFQESSEPFSHWLGKDVLLQFSNFARVLEKFNDMDLQFSFYTTLDSPFVHSYSSPVHVIAHRPMNGGGGGALEYLCQFTLETGTAFVWEPPTSDSPRELIEVYKQTRVRVANTKPERPANCQIAKEHANSFTSRDGKWPRDYQIDGVNWMLKCFSANHGCVLADEMGLGKTIQCLTMLMHLNRTTEFHGPYVIAVRTNTFTQWCSEIERWSDLKYIAYTGLPETRQLMRDYMMPYTDDEGVAQPGILGFNVLLVTYEIFLKDYQYFEEIDWQIMFIDEGHRIKNQEGKKYNAFVSLPVMHRVILTGTPIQSTLHELWTLLNFVSEEYFVDSSMFPDDDVESLEEDVLGRLRNIIAPHLMRRSLLDVEKSVVPKEERIAFLQITNVQKELMRLTKMHELWRVAPDANKLESNILHRICNHPFLVDGAARYYMPRDSDSERLRLMIDCSAKFMFLDRILPIFRESRRSVLIFSQRVKILHLLAEYCTLKKFTHSMLVGTLTEVEKKAEISRFCDHDEDVFIFLISTRSGSEGLNLTKASITIIFDPDWNPQNDLQALGRCHRIGQTQKVDVIRLITYGTYEHHMFARAQRKLRLWTTLLGDGETTDPSKAQKVEVEEEEERIGAVDTLLGLSVAQNSNDMAGVFGGSVRPISEETELKGDEIVIPAPPAIEEVDTDGCDDFEKIIGQLSTDVRDISILGSSRKIPEADISLGESDENFLNRFPIDASVLVDVVKHRNRAAENHRVDLDPKLAKRILIFLAVHGYGEWEAIGAGVNHYVPLEQLTKFCLAAVVLHFRALDSAKVALFPLLLERLQNDIPAFDLSYVCCGDIQEWYSVLSKRSYLAGEAKVCKLISNHIHKTAFSCLLSMECHLLIGEWNREMANVSFNFGELPPMPGRTREQDEKLFHAIVSSEVDVTANDDSTRVRQIFNVMKSHMLGNNVSLHSRVLEFWTSSEVDIVIETIRDFGVMSGAPQYLFTKTGLLSKTVYRVREFADWFVRELQSRVSCSAGDIIVPAVIARTSTAPPACRDPIVISRADAMMTVKRIMLCTKMRRAVDTIQQKQQEGSNIDRVISGGHEWWTLKHCVLLFGLLRKYGMNSLASILITPSIGFADQLTEADRRFLTTFDRTHLDAPDSKLPTFLVNESRFYHFLNWIVGDSRQTPVPAIQQQQQRRPPESGAQRRQPPPAPAIQRLPPPPMQQPSHFMHQQQEKRDQMVMMYNERSRPRVPTVGQPLMMGVHPPSIYHMPHPMVPQMSMMPNQPPSLQPVAQRSVRPSPVQPQKPVVPRDPPNRTITFEIPALRSLQFICDSPSTSSRTKRTKK